MKLISMTEFVLEKDITEIKQRDSIINYANFLSQKLSLEMFIPCKLAEGVWVVLEEPVIKYETTYIYRVMDWKEAKERVLFEGFKYEEWLGHSDDFHSSITNGILHIFWYSLIEKKFNVSKGMETIEDLVKYNLELTPTAKKQIGL